MVIYSVFSVGISMSTRLVLSVWGEVSYKVPISLLGFVWYLEFISVLLIEWWRPLYAYSFHMWLCIYLPVLMWWIFSYLSDNKTTLDIPQKARVYHESTVYTGSLADWWHGSTSRLTGFESYVLRIKILHIYTFWGWKYSIRVCLLQRFWIVLLIPCLCGWRALSGQKKSIF